MTWPFENDTGAIVKKLAKRSLAGESFRHSCPCACRRVCRHPEHFPHLCERQNTKLWTAPHHRRNTQADPAHREKGERSAGRHWDPDRHPAGRRPAPVPKRLPWEYYGIAVLLTAVVCWVMVSVSVYRPVKIAANISPLEAMRFLAGQEKVHNRKKHRKLSPISMGFANFGRDRKKSVSIAVSLSLGGILLLTVASVCLDGAQA